MRSIGLDVGDKTIGIAISDPLGIMAQGLFIYARTASIKKDTDAMIDCIKEYECDKVVIGLPLNLDGSDSIQTEKVREFARRLSNKMRSTGMSDISVIFEDERFTTKIAEYALIEANLSRGQRKKVIDKQAAMIILQSYLDAQRNTV
jgi:putative Holliday junction resolvase